MLSSSLSQQHSSVTWMLIVRTMPNENKCLPSTSDLHTP